MCTEYLFRAQTSAPQPTLCTEHPFRAQTSAPQPILCTKHLFRAQTSAPQPTLCTEYPFRAQTSAPQPTLCTKHLFRAQTSAPQQTLCTEYPFRAQKKEADLWGQHLSVLLLSVGKIISMLLRAYAGMLQEVCPLQPLQPCHSRSSPYPEVQSSMHTVSCPQESYHLCKHQTKLHS